MTEVGDLRLDLLTLDDVAAVHRIYSDPRVWTHLPSGRHAEIGVTEQMIRARIAGWERDELSTWIVRDRGTGEVLGCGGCEVRGGAFWNLGYRLAYEAHGRGIATWLAGQAIEQAHLVRPDLLVIAYLLEHNLASARVAEKVGLALRHRGPDAGNPDPTAIRLVYADRPLSDRELQAALA
ncbi:MAG: GNAT family N-acetyltransferase [Propionicimonas sp.]|uniref:GNAT family N-acetyltransferase n=1 Tax=Propionicimonas sp. TaxID=1955623 RepID=UPI002B1F4D26|nr:GNAT family N-acetyltransferase [Propionicimonas sp.]MEA4943537.1 GNAT family N-acetyltransferase [Propionicimonas sp.]MEA5055508.1 GNAT family N-acetyltransferase [Propionicimonas sp.]MEA5117610.1 GNAT family N-acetyltransferase [Propionicimonas sp.]